LTLGAYVLLLSVTSGVTAQQPGRETSARKPQKPVPTVHFDFGNTALKIPLEIDNNIILMRVAVNNSKPLKFIFDTGASHTIINSQRAAELGLRTQGQASGTATGGAIQGSFIKGVSLRVPGAEVSNQTIGSMPFPIPPGFEFDGVIGYDFINQFVVEIDYVKKIMNLHNPRTFTYSGSGGIVPLSLAGRRTPLAHTKIILEGRAPVGAELEVDTGADGTFVINSPFVRKQSLVAAIAKTTQSSGVGVGGEQKLLVGRVKAVRLGRFILNNPTVALSLDTEGSGASAEIDGLIGGEVFRRFKVILDYSRKQMILEPNKNLNDPYDIERGDQ
jgi:predicted aspartyl protease